MPGPDRHTKKTADPSASPPPLRGFLTIFPRSWIPYVELTRLNKPAGIIVIYLPYQFGLMFAAIVRAPPVAPLSVIHSTIFMFLASVVLRSAGCTWNDAIDHKLDQQVARTRLRPVARGAVSPTTAISFFVAQMLVWLSMLYSFCPRGIFYAVLNVPLVLIYPYAKRYMDYPQLVLGITLAWGMFSGSAALGVDFIALQNDHWSLVAGLGCLIVAYVAWTGVYDTIYAFQDVRDDAKAGARSMAVRWRHHGKLLLGVLITLQIAFLGLAGWMIDAGEGYFLIACGASATVLVTMIWTVDLEQPDQCAWWFKNGIWMVGTCMLGGLTATYVARLLSV